MKLPNGGTAIGSIELKRQPKGRRVYAYLRYTYRGRTINRYVGGVTSESRAESLRRGWQLAREKALLRPSQEDLQR